MPRRKPPLVNLDLTSDIVIHELKMKILHLLAAENPEDDTAVLAIADVLGTIAATSDNQSAGRTLKDKLHAVCRRVEETYERLRNKMETTP